MEQNNVNVGDENLDETVVDETQEDGFDVGQGEGLDTGDGAPASEAPPEPPTPPTGETPSVVGSISERLGSQATTEETKDDTAPKADSPIPFDINSLSREQLQSLKALLNSTPEGQIRESKNPVVTLRKIDGKYIIDFKRAMLGLVKDGETGRDVERHLIPVKFKGEEEFVSVLYSNFINSERVPCEVLSHKEEKKPVVEGQTFSRKRGTMVDMVRTQVISYFTIKLPEGETIDIEGRLANA